MINQHKQLTAHISKHYNTISLLNWPQQPPHSYPIKLSPKTAKTLKSAKLNYQSLLPLTFQQYQYISSQHDQSGTNLYQSYQQDKLRRKQKVDILREIRKNYSRKNNHSQSRSKEKYKFRFSGSSSRAIKTDRSLNSKQFQSKKLFRKSQFYAKNKEKAYLEMHRNYHSGWDYYDGAKIYKKNNKKPYDDESTRSRRESNQYQVHGKPLKKKVVYSSKQSKQLKKHTGSSKYLKKSLLNPDQNLLFSLGVLVDKWAQIDQRQEAQLNILLQHKNSSENITQQEKKRLLKIHHIEKQQLKYEIDKIRIQLSSHRKKIM